MSVDHDSPVTVCQSNPIVRQSRCGVRNGSRNRKIWRRIFLTTFFAILSTVIGAAASRIIDSFFEETDSQCDHMKVTDTVSLLSSTGMTRIKKTENDHTLEKVKFVDPPKTVRGHTAILQIEVAKDILDESAVWLGVRAANAPDTIWLQGTGVDTPRTEEVIYLGRNNVASDVGKYQVRIVSFPTGQIKSDGPLKITTAKKIGMKTLASVVIERAE